MKVSILLLALWIVLLACTLFSPVAELLVTLLGSAAVGYVCLQIGWWYNKKYHGNK